MIDSSILTKCETNVKARMLPVPKPSEFPVSLVACIRAAAEPCSLCRREEEEKVSNKEESDRSSTSSHRLSLAFVTHSNDVGGLSHCPNGAQLKQPAMTENCWCMRTMRARIPPNYQLNILTRIE
jgi:hypothetical protein